MQNLSFSLSLTWNNNIIIYSCYLHPLFPQGLIDVEKEVAKLMTKKGDLEKQMEKLREKMAKNDYKEKVPVKVQEQDAEKVGKIDWFCGFFLKCKFLVRK